MATATNGRAKKLANAATIGDVTTTWQYITPEIAEAYLALNKRNRRFMPSLSDRYRSDMVEEQWLLTHEGVAFDEENNLIDGQHRLEAIIKSGKPQWMLVTQGLSVEVIEVINRGKMRTLAHALQIMGYECSTSRSVAIARRMQMGPHSVSTTAGKAWVSNVSMRKFIAMNTEAIMFASAHFSQAAGPASIAAIIARAYYNHDTERLARFQEAMLDHIDRDELMPGDGSARLLRRCIDSSTRMTGSTASGILYRKGQNALAAYLRRIDLAKLYECDDDLFPLPKEKMIPQFDTTE